MNKKHIRIIVASLTLSIVIGGFAGIATKENRHDRHSHSTAVVSQYTALEEEFWNVDLIIQGTVLREGDTYFKDTGVVAKRDNSMPVTPATIQINKILYGETDETEITYLQHGLSDDKIASGKMVKKSEDVLLILSRTNDGTYWSYNFDDGIWRIKDGKVKSDSHSKLLNVNNEKEQDLEQFIDKITKAATNKKKLNDNID